MANGNLQNFAPVSVRGATPRTPGFSETVVAPFAQAVTARNKFNLEQSAQNQRALATALAQMGQIGVPGQNPGAPTIDLQGVGGLPILPRPISGADELAAAKARGYGQITEKDLLSAAVKINDPLQAMLFGAQKDPNAKVNPIERDMLNLLQAIEAMKKKQNTYSEAQLQEAMTEFSLTRDEAIAEFASRGWNLTEE
jgi:hypothetical protein